MKKIMGIMLGLSLVLGAASVSFANDTTTKSTTKTKKSKKHTSDTSKTTSK